MTPQKVGIGDWVLICGTSERGQVLEIFDGGERCLVGIDKTEAWPFPKRIHVMIEKVRKLKPPKLEKKIWKQETLF